jgi:hypothetical protein
LEHVFEDEYDKLAVLSRVRDDKKAFGGNQNCGATIRKRYTIRLEVGLEVDAALSPEVDLSRTKETVENRWCESVTLRSGTLG